MERGRGTRRRQWHPTSLLLPGKSHGWRGLVGFSPRGHKESDTSELLHFTFMHWRREWQPTPVFLPGESQGQRSIVGYRLQHRTESDTTEATQQQQQLQPLNRCDFIFLGSKITVDGDHSHEIKRCYLLGNGTPTPVLLPGKSHRWRSLVGCSPWGR